MMPHSKAQNRVMLKTAYTLGGLAWPRLHFEALTFELSNSTSCVFTSYNLSIATRKLRISPMLRRKARILLGIFLGSGTFENSHAFLFLSVDCL